MLVLDDSFTITQSFIFLFIALISFILGFFVYNKDRTYALNQIFSLGIILLGGSYLFSFLGNLYYIILGNNDPFYIRTAFFLAPIAFMFFYLTSYGMYKGFETIYSKGKVLVFVFIFIVNLFVIYFQNGVYYVSKTDTNSSLEFKITNLFVILILYLIVYYYFIRCYLGVEDTFVKNNIEYFLIGWFFGGLGLLSIVGSDAIRELDLLGPIFIGIGMIIIARSFLTRSATPNK